ESQDVGRDGRVLKAEELAGAAEASDHFIQNHEHAVAIANLAHALEVAIGRRENSAAADHRLGDDSGYRLRTFHADHALEFIRATERAGRLRRAEVAAI